MCPLVEGGDSQPLVLVIDDNADSRELYRLYLVQNGCQVIEAADGLDGYRLAATQRPAAITLDELLPGELDGIATCQKLKADPGTRHIPVIAVTGSAKPDDLERLKAAGCASVLIKPCLPETLHEEVTRLLNARLPGLG